MSETSLSQVIAKTGFKSIAERRRTINRILSVIQEKNDFLLLGHELPDEDCISSLVAMSLLIKKFNKKVTICLTENIPDHLSYLFNICTYNEIELIREGNTCGGVHDVIIVLDTPKPDMIAAPEYIKAQMKNASQIVMEIDHHLNADAACSGKPGYCLVAQATSTCELISFICFKLAQKKDVLEKFQISELFSRNLVLALLTGIIGDTHFGLILKKNRDIFFYNFFTRRFSIILEETVHKNSKNYTSMTDIFNSMQSLSPEERDLYRQILDQARYFGRTGYLYLNEEKSYELLKKTEYRLFVKVIKAATDFLAEKSGRLGLTVYFDTPDVSDLIQFRIRASRLVTDIDLRTIITDFSITDGGGHPGAVGFRLPKSQITDLDSYIKEILKKLEEI